VYAHRLTAWPGANRYADWYAAHAKDHAAMPESAPMAEQCLRASAFRLRDWVRKLPSAVYRAGWS
jgi:hypothetical protein